VIMRLSESRAVNVYSAYDAIVAEATMPIS
jgi:hypothetical protein